MSEALRVCMSEPEGVDFTEGLHADPTAVAAKLVQHCPSTMAELVGLFADDELLLLMRALQELRHRKPEMLETVMKAWSFMAVGPPHPRDTTEESCYENGADEFGLN